MMPAGPGKYDALCLAAMAAAQASVAVLVIIDGVHGHGFSVNCIDKADAHRLPSLLREIADGIESDMKAAAQ